LKEDAENAGQKYKDQVAYC